MFVWQAPAVIRSSTPLHGQGGIGLMVTNAVKEKDSEEPYPPSGHKAPAPGSCIPHPSSCSI